MRGPATLAAALGALAGCGDPLVGPDYLGEPVFVVGGVVRQGNLRIPASHGPLRLGVLWIGGAPVEQAGRLDAGLASYALTLFEPPPIEAAGFSDLLPGGTLALGVIALYADRDGDGALGLDRDLLLGASAQHVLVHASAAIEPGARAAALLGAAAAGYHVYVHEAESRCRLVEAAACPPEGRLARADDPGGVPLTLWATAEEVIVPAAAVARGATPTSLWARP